MSDETSPSPEPTEAPAESAPRVRRISNPRPKKKEVAKESAPVSDEAPVSESKASQDWPDAAETVSDTGESAEAKRKRRRRKGKGGKNKDQGPVNQVNEEVHSLSESAPGAPVPSNASPQQPQRQQHAQQQPQNQSSRASADPKELATKAWKIFLAEVSEEGVSLIGDHDARELSRRCFKLAEIFMEEKSRRMR